MLAHPPVAGQLRRRPAPPPRGPIAAAVAATAPPPSPAGLPHTVLSTFPGGQLRLYGAYAVAWTPYASRPEGIARLAAFLEARGWPPSQPLVLRYTPRRTDGRARDEFDKRMELRVPATGAAAAAATAAVDDGAGGDDGVRVGAAGGRLMAAAELRGSATPEAAASARAALAAACAAAGLRVVEAGGGAGAEEGGGGFELHTYGPMHSLRERVSELLVEVALPQRAG